MKVHVICHGLFGIVLSAQEGHQKTFQDAEEVVFLDAAGWKAKEFAVIPRHELFVRYSDSQGKFRSEILKESTELPITELRITGAPAGKTEVISRPVKIADVLRGHPSSLRPGCSGAGGDGNHCLLGESPLIRARMKLRGGTLRNCEFHPINGVDFDERRNSWGSQHLDYEWPAADGGDPHVSKTSNAVLYSFDTGEKTAELLIGEHSFRLGPANEMTRMRMKNLDEHGEGFALVTLNNTVPKSALEEGHFHLEPNRDTHSLLFHELLAEPLPVDQRPIPRLTFRAAAGLEAPPLSRCIPYSY